MRRFTLRYTTHRGQDVVLYNLGAEAVCNIKRAQEHLGSYDFAQTEQPHCYSQEELEARRGYSLTLATRADRI